MIRYVRIGGVSLMSKFRYLFYVKNLTYLTTHSKLLFDETLL